MATKISELVAAGALSGTELVPVVQSGSTVRTTAQAMANLGGGTPVTLWDFSAHGSAYPTDLTKIYIATEDSVLPLGTWFFSNGSGGFYTK